MHLGAAGRRERRGIGRLVVVERIGIGNEKAGRPMTAISETVEAPEREMTRCAAAMRIGHVGEEGQHLRHHAELGIGRLDAADVVGARLLRDEEARALLRRQSGDRGRHRVGEELRALAAAEDEQPERLAGLRTADRACAAA